MTGTTLGSAPITGVYPGGRLATGVYFGGKRIWPSLPAGGFPIGVGAMQLAPCGLLVETGKSIRIGASPLNLAGQRLAVAIGGAVAVDVGRGALQLGGRPPSIEAGAAANVGAASLAFDARALAVVAGRAVPMQPGSLQLASRALATAVGGGISIDIAPGSLAITPKTLVPVLGAAFSGDMAAAALQIAGRALAVNTGASLASGAGSLALHGEALTVATGRSAAVAISPSVLTLTGPALAVSAGASAAMGAGDLALTPQALTASGGGGGGGTEDPVVVGVVSVDVGTNGKLSFTGLTPANGNQLVIAVFHGGAQTSTKPTGFDFVDSNPSSDPGIGCDIYTKVSDGTETAIDVPVSSNSSSGFAIWISGQNATNPINVHLITGSDSAGTTINFPTGTPTVANTLAIGFAAWSQATTPPPTQSAGWTFLNQTAPSGGFVAGCAWQAQDASLSAVSGSMTVGGSVGKRVSALLLIAP